MIPLGILAAAGGTAEPAMELIQTVALTSDQSSITLSSIPQTYKRLQLRAVLRGSDTTTSLDYKFNFNGDTGGNYRSHMIQSNGSTQFGSAPTDTAFIFIEAMAGAGQAANIFTPIVMDILDYSSTTKNKTTRALAGNVGTANRVSLASGLWRSNAAITSIVVTPNVLSFVTGSRISLYGIKG